VGTPRVAYVRGGMTKDLLTAEFGSFVAIGFTIAAVAAVCLAFSFGRFMSVGRRAARDNSLQLQRQTTTFDVALNHMSQGLVMFNGDSRATLWNQRYIEISGVSDAFLQRSPTFRDILIERQKAGTFEAEIDAYIDHQVGGVAKGEISSFVREDPNGRFCNVVIAPMPGGGWVATHEDITAQVKAKQVIEEQRMQLNAAVSNMSQGLCMFDKDQRLIVCNQQYADIYGMPNELKKPGTSLSMILRHSGHLTHDADSLDDYVNDRIKKVQQKKAYQIVNRLKDDRLISVVHRAMPDGGWVSTHEDITDSKRREESFRLLFDGSPMAMWVVDCETLFFLAVNEAAIQHYGYSRDQFMKMKVSDLRAEDDRGESLSDYLNDMRANRHVQGRVVKHRRSDGNMMDIEIYSRPLIYDDRAARITVVQDITRAKLATDELSRTRKFLDAVIENVPVPLIVRDVAGIGSDVRSARFNLFNRAYEQLTGDDRGALIGKTADELYPRPRADLVIAADYEAMNSEGVVEIPEHTIDTNGNGRRLVTGKKTVIRDDDGNPQYLLTVLDDITERRRAEERIAYLAHNDSLTDLPNRATFVDYLDKTLARAERSKESFAILCVDLDRFKEANDVYGHLIGDALLREAARRLNAAAGGQFIARVGGDEFTLIAIGCADSECARALSEKLLAAVQPPFEVDGQRLSLGLSIGGAIYPVDGADATTLIANADAALYQAKAESRGSLRLFDAKLAAQLHERRERQLDLHTAISRGEFLLHYQPLEKLADGEITGFESLVRWQCPRRGMVPPGDFISIAEETGLIVPLGNWILREACREAASWPKPLKIAVNISPVQFRSGDLAAQVHLILLETGLAPSRLELEITEGVMIDDFSRAVSILRKLKALGVLIAMDDFGSGYSSLSYLHSFAFDKIKIDRSFIGDVEANHHSMAIVRAIVTLGHSLGVPVLAEGVETEGQRRFLAAEGCDGAQGYLLGRPQPIAFYAEMVGRQPEAEGKPAPRADAVRAPAAKSPKRRAIAHRPTQKSTAQR
jgi:diguanylate cyclase (GGDEF)-like protein/PAS domain S-box-containing protein